MSDRKLAKAAQVLLRHVRKLARSITRALVHWLLRTALVAGRTRHATAGFVLPTTILLILVVTLTAGSFAYRAMNTSTRAIGEAQNRAVYNAATPAVDRARAKLEFLFDANRDTRFPSGVPSEEVLASMLLNDNSSIKGRRASPLLFNNQDPYTLPGETRISINDDNGDGRIDTSDLMDNAWRYKADTDGDGADDATVVYSILFSTPPDTPAPPPSPGVPGFRRLIGLTDLEKATGRVNGTGGAIEAGASTAGGGGNRVMTYVRTGPQSTREAGACRTATTTNSGTSVEGGWFEDASSTAILRKNFQVDALVIPDNARSAGTIRNFPTLEFQQDRQLDRGNKWGAWFRNDLEIFPGTSGFQWNGAMHTEGSLLLGGSTFSAYLISAPQSCFWYESASEISVTNVDDPVTGDRMVGQVVSGRINDNQPGGSSLVYIWANNFNPTTNRAILDTSTDSVTSVSPADVSSNPNVIHTRNGYRSRGGDPTNVSYSDSAYPDRSVADRFQSKRETAPYVDDTYRADNRYGPHLRYDNRTQVPANRRIGEPIQPSDNVAEDPNRETILAGNALTPETVPAGTDVSQVGLDGYWERRARIQGLRVLVGQRLELGNMNGWVAPQDRPSTTQQALDAAVTYNTVNGGQTPGDGDLLDLRRTDYSELSLPIALADVPNADPFISDNEGDPLYPPHSVTDLPHEARQRRALRDNLSAVQATAVYHAAVGQGSDSQDYPIACIASTAHPGSPISLRQSVNFVPTFFKNGNSNVDNVLLTDFFTGRGTNGWEFTPPAGDATAFGTAINNPSSALRIALQNLANFAGDHINENRTGAFPPSQIAGEIHPDPELSMWGNFSNLRRTLAQLNAGTSYTNLSPADKTYLHTAACTLGMLAYNIDQVQQFDPRNLNNDAGDVVEELAEDLELLMNGIVDEDDEDLEVLPRQRLSTYNYSTASSGGPYNPRDYDFVPPEAFLGKLRELYFSYGISSPLNERKLRLAELIFAHFQIRRDRTFGFRPSPAANTWNYNPYVTTDSGDVVRLWSSACDPNIFSIGSSSRERDYGIASVNAEAANSNDAFRSTRKLALARLCGTVIPPGALRDYPGDTGFPARNRSTQNPPNYGTGTEKTTYGTALQQFLPRTPSSGNPFHGSVPILQSPSTFAVTADASPFNPLNTAPWNGDPNPANPNQFRQEQFLRASVAPKFPALYYLFPEFDHNHDGSQVGSGLSQVNGVIDLQGDGIGASNSDNDSSDDVDQRQPNGRLPLLGVAPGGTPMIAAFQPWAEPYITDPYVITANAGVTYRVVPSSTPDRFTCPMLLPAGSPSCQAGGLVGYVSDRVASTPAIDPLNINNGTSQLVYKTFDFPIADRPVDSIALQPRIIPTSISTPPPPLASNQVWQLPVFRSTYSDTSQNVPTNRILAPNGNSTTGRQRVVPFLDRVLFNGREWMPVRVMDIDLGMLRRTGPSGQTAGQTEDAPNDVWLPASGIVYAFREDAVREDAINRPGAAAAVCPGGVGNAAVACTNARNVAASDPIAQVDPALTVQGASVKAVDFVPDPQRRPHGFRLRNGSQLTRSPSLGIPANDTRGLSFFTDNPVYIMGHYNLHQRGSDDSGTPPNDTNRLEEFTQRLPDDAPYTETQFYGRRTRDDDFAVPGDDRWRPSEILADAITVLSNTFCDGSVLDTFMTAGQGSNASIVQGTISGGTRTESNDTLDDNLIYPYRDNPGDNGGASIYNNIRSDDGSALYGSGLEIGGIPGCREDGRTSFLNQNRPRNPLPTLNIGSSVTLSWEWLRENPYDRFSPVKISRNGDGILIPPTLNGRPSDRRNRPMVPTPYNLGYYSITAGDARPLQSAENTRINSTLIAGIPPSRTGQSYGGLHNFPRMLEDWRIAAFPAPAQRNLWLAGSFLQLNFSNYATAPFDADAWEPGTSPSTDPGVERNRHYDAPNRFWGYDVALQSMPAGPVAARFVAPGRDRSEFYHEPSANDPYIRNLCLAVPDDVLPDDNCPR
jgi:hypothetical protein